MKTPLTKKKLREHIRYHGWKYVLLVVLSIFGWNLIFTTTAYRPGPEKIVDVYAYGNVTADSLQVYMAYVQHEKMPDMEQMKANVIMEDGTYDSYILTTRVAAAEGDIYILPRDRFETFSAEGMLAPLEGETGLMSVLSGANLERGYWYRKNSSDETGERERHLYGIPLSAIPNIDRLIEGYTDPDNTYACVIVNNGNDANVIRFLSILADKVESDKFFALVDSASTAATQE